MKRPTTKRGSSYKMAYQRRRVCRFCVDKSLLIDYKDTGTLQYFVTDRGKIIPRRISGNCAKHQRQVTRAVKRGRNLAMAPYTTPIA